MDNKQFNRVRSNALVEAGEEKFKLREEIKRLRERVAELEKKLRKFHE